ncbi:hypothetical protein PtA15_1A594 [Puccinia triticina]|uniref:HTH APSES-type domain-containing protein n=1 Tax=Puccinia triticina TaxID=208348 RepID=A0ABY7C7Y2_9BASI|nr:uncharacterized protein PtA15_1A594 [Puccinia triticina]WAQ81254.1 hypothetical protein PtA15_1A594 [Puccinia triticina]
MSQPSLYSSNNPPSLPQDKFHETLVNYQGKLRSVRTQDIKLGTTSVITIARIKIPAPDKVSSHLIKRFDTNAISASSFFKSAFPHATEEEEACHMNYLQEIYDTRRAGALDLGPEHRLTGVWVPIENAAELAEEYGLTRFVVPLIAIPNPNPSPSSPAAIKNAGENEPLSTQTPKAIHPSKQSDQTPVTRSSKRSRAGPLSFGNTSPSSFNLSTFNKPPTEIKKPSTHDSKPTGITDKDNEENSASQTDPVTAGGQKNSPIKTTTTDENNELPEHAEETASPQLIGTDEMVNRAKQEALRLVSDLKNSQINVQAAKESQTKAMDVESRTSPEKTDKLNRKRSVDEVSAEEEGVQEAEETPERSTSRSFLPKLLWRRSATQAQANSKKVKRFNQAGSAGKSFAPLPANTPDPSADQSLSPLNPNKRNLAIAGIVIAGAAASIAPYFF